MTTKCLVISLWLQLFIGFVLWNFITCDCRFPTEEIINGEYIYSSPIDAERNEAKEFYVLFFRCSVGYERIGAYGRQCMDGKWTGEVPSCKAMQCGAPPSIDNGNYTFTANNKTEITIGTQAIYSCEPGYGLSNSSVSNLTCILNEDKDETLWAGDVPVCQAVKPCSDPGFSMNGLRKGDCCLRGNIASYTCNEGFEMVGEQDIECLLSTRWSYPRPLCRPLENHCERPPDIPNGAVIMMSGDYALPSEEVEIVCKPGYKYNGPNQFPYCNESAIWEDEFGECKEIVCDRPETFVNGDIPELEKSDFNDTFPYNFVLNYDCNKGYRLKGGEPWTVCGKDGWSERNSYCEGYRLNEGLPWTFCGIRGWSGTNPYCEEIFCPDPGAPEYGSRQGDTLKVGARVRFKCFTGYELLGSDESYCRPNGQWTGELARCNAKRNYCPNPGTPINGMRNGENYNEGDTVEFRCRSGFFQTGSKVRTCMADRTWDGTETRCLGPHDFDRTEEIGRILKQRLKEQFDKEIRECLMRISAKGIPSYEKVLLKMPPRGRLIMYFAFDVSGSIQKANFKKGIEFAKAIVRRIGVSEEGTLRVGALVFGSRPINLFFPMDYSNTQDVLDHLDSIELYTDGGLLSETSALQLVIWNIQLEEQQETFYKNNKKKNVLFLITDGKANMGSSLEKEANILKDKMNVEIFCIGITGDVKSEVLRKIASTSTIGNEERSNAFILKNYARMDWLIQDITDGTIDYSQCGLGMESKLNSNQGRMIGGEISVEPWPWMAMLFLRDLRDKASQPELICGGSIISEYFILTAAHCLFERDKKTSEYRKISEGEIIVKFGLVKIRSYTYLQEFEVETIYIHDGYIMAPDAFHDNDIALLKLYRPIWFNEFVRPVCLPPAVLPEDNNNPLYKPGEYGWVIGFGHEKQVKVRPAEDVHYKLRKQLKELRLSIQSNSTCCLSLEKENNSFTERMFCTKDGLFSNDTKETEMPYKGDGGGAFMQPHMNPQGNIYWTQVGIVSWGKGCGNKGQYGFYTHVQRFRPWIDQKIKEIAPEAEEM